MKKNILLSSTCLAVCLGIASFVKPVDAQTTDEWAARPIMQSEYLEHQHEWNVFLEYRLHREPCQNYRTPPDGYILKGCNVYRDYPTAEPQSTMTTTETITQTKPTMGLIPPESMSYTIYFDHDKSNIRRDQRDLLTKAANAIKKYKPSEVMVSGYAATSGTEEHNQKLSERRAQNTAHELGVHGVGENTVEQMGYGETHLAVLTPNGDREPANRRVVINFKR